MFSDMNDDNVEELKQKIKMLELENANLSGFNKTLLDIVDSLSDNILHSMSIAKRDINNL